MNGEFDSGSNFPAPWIASGNITHITGVETYAQFNDSDNSPNGVLSQQIATTTCGEYELTFQLREGGNPLLSDKMGVEVFIDGVSQDTFLQLV